MIKKNYRKMILRECGRCKEKKLVRKDGAGDLCRSCRAYENQKLKKPKDITNEKFGKLTVISFSYIKKHAFWNCKCECGNTCVVSGTRMRSGHTSSCGCIQKSRKGLSTSPIYRTWKAMIQRCYDKKVEHYARYGGKGIKVCERWKNSFDNFRKDMGDRPENLTLDRIDGNKDYSPDNCRWSSYKEQGNNKKQGCFITAFGKTKRLTEWQEETGIGWSTIRKRIYELGWNAEKALTKTIQKRREKSKVIE